MKVNGEDWGCSRKKEKAGISTVTYESTIPETVWKSHVKPGWFSVMSLKM